jgi:hypothetical protein
VQNIRKQQLDELRQLARPPKSVQLTLEVVCIMMGEKNLEWGEIRKVVRREDFIPTVVNFDPTTLTQKQVQLVQSDYFSNEAHEFDYASVDRASKACGPLYPSASTCRLRLHVGSLAGWAVGVLGFMCQEMVVRFCFGSEVSDGVLGHVVGIINRRPVSEHRLLMCVRLGV